MCGLAGIVRYDAPPDEARLRRMQRALRHRGPDGEGLALAGAAALAHTRLALVDLAGGAQPLTSADGRYTLVYNGEVYNWRELRAELDGVFPFRTRSDSEVVLAALTVWGEAALARLNGMFAFFLWDNLPQRGLAARDRLGVKPFVYRFLDGELRFASESKAILAADDERPRAHAESILEYLVAPAFSGVEHSMFDGIDHLQAGQLLRVSRDGIAVERWWRLALRPEPGSHVEELRAGVKAAVTRALRADVPVGVYLSGGLDSTLIAAHARAARPPAFTVRFDAQDRYDYARSTIVGGDDTPFAALAARELGLEQELCEVSRSSLARDLGRLAIINDALPAWEQELAQHHLAARASRRVKAVLVGDAADETHFGYHFLLDEAAVASPATILARLGSVPVRADRLADPAAHFTQKYLTLAGGGDTLDERRLATTRLILLRWLPRLLHNGDIHAMRWSLEARVPFADVELLAIAARVPPAEGLRGGVEKWALREAARGLVPDAIRRRKKSALPKDQLAQRIYQDEARPLLDEPGLAGEYVDLRALAPLCDPARALTEAERASLFRVVSLARWAEHYRVAP